MSQPHPAPRKFRVRVGLASVQVIAADVCEAIRSARESLCRDMPRLFDVIADLDEAHFCVEPLPVKSRRDQAER